MFVLRSLAVLLLLPFWVQAMAPWTSTDMKHKEDADRKLQAQKLSDLNDVQERSRSIDSLLFANKSILAIAKEQLARQKKGNMPMAKQIKVARDALQQAQKDETKKQMSLEDHTEKINKADGLVNKTKIALAEATKHLEESRKADNIATANARNAEDYLEKTVIEHPQDAQAASQALAIRQTELASAHKALEAATHQLDAEQKALASAKTAAEKASEEYSKAVDDYQGAFGKVKGLEKALSDLTKSDETPEKKIELVEASIEKQEAVVSSLAKLSKELHDEVAAKTKAHEESSATVDKDIECIQTLKQYEINLNLSTHRFELTATAYKAAGKENKMQMFGAAWTLKDRMDAATYALRQAQKTCAPKGVEIPTPLPPPKCDSDTGGSCWLLQCHATRKATCNSDSKCTCAAGTCAIDGACVRRSSPVLLASPPTELPAEPAAWSAVFLAAFALVVTAALAVRRRRASEIQMPESTLG